MSWLIERGKKGTLYYCAPGQVWKSLKTNNRTIAVQLQQELDRKLQLSENGVVDLEMTWKAYRQEYEESCRVNAENTLVKLGYVLNSFEKIIRPVKLRGVSAMDCERWRSARLQAVEPVTVEGESKYLRPFFRRAHELGYIDKNPLGFLRPLKFARKRGKRVTPEEMGRFLEAVEPQYHLLGVFLCDTGMRREEISAQRMEDVNFVRKTINIRNHADGCVCLKCSKKRQMERRTKRPGLFNTKNLGEREIPMTPRLRDLLLEFQKKQPSGCIFQIHELTITEIAKRAFARAGVEGKVAAHTLRHCFADDLRRAGVDEEVRKVLLGHSGMKDAHGNYMHVSEEELFDAVEKLVQWRADQAVKVQKTTVDGFQMVEAVAG